jgi:hypothetical protein
MKLRLGLILLSLATITQPAWAEDFTPEVTCDLAPGVKLVMQASKFKESEHAIRKIGDQLLIDGKQAIGLVDGAVPKTQLDKATLIIEDKKIELDVSCLYNPWFTTPEKDSFALSAPEESEDAPSAQNIGGLIASFPEGIIRYSVEWRIVDGTALRVEIEED